ncbi:MAG: AI-2E family transporter [Limnospira sp.]
MTIGKWIGIISFLVSLYIVWKISHIILLAFTAVILAIAINRIVRRLQKSGVNRAIAVAISVGSILMIILGFLALTVPVIVQQWQELTDRIPQGLEQLKQWYTQLQTWLPSRMLGDMNNIEDVIQQLASSYDRWIGSFFTFFSSSVETLLQTLLVIAITIMLLSNPKPYRQAFILLFPSFYRRRVDAILDQCEESVVGCVLGILFNMVVIGIMSGLGLWILGVRLALVNALLAAVLTLIPNLGPTISVIPPAILALLDSPWKSVSVIVLYIAIQQMESNILTPLVMKRQVSLLPAVTLLSQITFALFFGALGLFLALPLVVILQVWLRELLVEDILNPWSKPNIPKIKTPSEDGYSHSLAEGDRSS